MNEEIKAKRDELTSWFTEVEGFKDSHRAMFKNGFDAGFALSMEEAMSLVECLKVVGNYLYFMGDELTGDDLIGDESLTRRYNEKLNLIEQALKEFQEKTGVK